MLSYSRKELSFFLKKKNIHLTKKRGQNFLIDPNSLQKIVNLSKITLEDQVIEIGGGFGHLSFYLNKVVNNLIVFEVDKNIYKNLIENFKFEFKNNKIKIYFKDALKVNWAEYFNEINGKRIVISNTPYSISTLILEKCFSYVDFIDRLILTFQKDFALRIVSQPGDVNYGALSVFAQIYSSPTLHFKISKNAFFPVPKVESLVISFDCRKNRLSEINNIKFFKLLVKSIFSTRRKTLYNSLRKNSFLKLDKNKINLGLNKLFLNPKIRGENLSINNIIKLSNQLN